jgi:type I restriction enzyme, S subunit
VRELPEGWSYESLKEITSKIGSGSTPRGGSEAYKTQGIPLIRSMNIHFSGIKYDGLAFIDDEQAKKLNNVEVFHNDVLLNITGASIGRVTIAPKGLTGARVNQHVSIIRMLECVDPRYINYFIASPNIQSLIVETEAGVTRQALTKEKIEDLQIPLPPLNEQKRIADRLDQLLTRIDKTKAYLDRIPPILKRFRQSVLAAATSGKLTEDWRKSDEYEIQEFHVKEPYYHSVSAPAEWDYFDLGSVCEFIGGSQPPKSHFQPEFKPGLIRLIQIRDYKSDRFETYIPVELARRFCTKDDVMIGRYGPPIFQILRGLEGAYNVALMKAVSRIDHLDREYLYYWLQKDDLLKYVEGGSDRTVGQDGVRKDLLHSYPFFLPSLLEQQEIVRRVEALFAKADRIEAQYKTARQQVDRLTPALLARAFRGELVPQDPNDEPASVLLERVKEGRSATQPAKKGRVKKEKISKL